MSIPLVSICCITYNQEQFIAQAIDSFLMQETNFDFEIVIGEDCSKDTTGAIVKEYALQYPEKIRILDNSVNLGLQKNFFRTLHACRGEFIAYCEGDDYWIDPLKLQKQADVLLSNKDVVYCFSNAIMKSEENDTESLIFADNQKIPTKFELKEYIENYHPMPMLTTFFRSECIQNPPYFLYSIIQLDYALRFIIGSKGNFYFLNETTAVYRKHKGGIANNSISFLESMLKVNKELNAYFNYSYTHFFGYYPSTTYERLCYAYCEKRNIIKAIQYGSKCIFKSKWRLFPLRKIVLKCKHAVKLFLEN